MTNGERVDIPDSTPIFFLKACRAMEFSSINLVGISDPHLFLYSQVYCVFLFLFAASLFGTIIAQVQYCISQPILTHPIFECHFFLFDPPSPQSSGLPPAAPTPLLCFNSTLSSTVSCFLSPITSPPHPLVLLCQPFSPFAFTSSTCQFCRWCKKKSVII